jgi:hypothetical protein
MCICSPDALTFSCWKRSAALRLVLLGRALRVLGPWFCAPPDWAPPAEGQDLSAAAKGTYCQFSLYLQGSGSALPGKLLLQQGPKPPPSCKGICCQLSMRRGRACADTMTAAPSPAILPSLVHAHCQACAGKSLLGSGIYWQIPFS